MTSRPLESPAVRFDVAGLVVLRILAGASIAAYAIALLLGLHPFEEFLGAPRHFPYRGFEWVRAVPPPALRALAVVLAVAGVAMSAGVRYRATASIVAIITSYFFFVDSLYFDSVGFLAVLLLVLLAASPAHCIFSFDARPPPESRGTDSRWSSRLPCRGARASVALIQFQVGCVYFFSGIAKCYGAWLGGRTLRVMCPSYPPVRWLSPFFSEHFVYVGASWLGMLFDLTIVPLLCMRATRRIAFAALVLFHLHNALVLPLGAVPWIMLGASTAFLSPSWPRRFLRLPPSPDDTRAESWKRPLVLTWVILQLALPLRRWTTAGDPLFHEIGYDFTWALRSRSKDASVVFVVVDRTKGVPTFERPFPDLSRGLANRASRDPYLIWQSAQALARGREVAVYAYAFVSLNGGPSSQLVDPSVDLAHASFPLFGVPSWVRLRERDAPSGK